MMRGLLGMVTAAALVACGAACWAQATEGSKATQPTPTAETKKGEVKAEALQRWKNMTVAERERMRERMRRWQAMTPEERQKILANMERFRKLTPEQRERLVKARERWEQVAPEVRQRMHQRFERFKELSPEVRQRMLEHMTFMKEYLKSDFEAMKQAPEEQRDALRKAVHQKMRALMQLRGEAFDAFRKATPEEQAAKMKELMDKLPAEEHQGHEPFEGHHRGMENPKGEGAKPATPSTPGAQQRGIGIGFSRVWSRGI